MYICICFIQWTVLTAAVLGFNSNQFVAETSAVFALLHMSALETEVSEVTASATSDDINTDDDITDSSGLEDDSHQDSTILEESTLDAHDNPRF